ncbi:MAG: hypothetical protein C0404_09560 [Verrucomicrobia bacterium]|nr:hypothetical protein [Verrucomicrobiota bacterium]
MERTNETEFMPLFLAVQDDLMSYLLSVTRQYDEAKDLLQQVSLTLWEKFAEYDRARPFTPWAIGVAKYAALSWRRDKARERVVLSEEAVSALAEVAVEHAPGPARRWDYLHSCVEKLAANGKAVVQMRYSEGLKSEIIAARLGKSVKALDVMLVRIRHNLRDCVSRAMSEEHARGA